MEIKKLVGRTIIVVVTVIVTLVMIFAALHFGKKIVERQQYYTAVNDIKHRNEFRTQVNKLLEKEGQPTYELYATPSPLP